MKLHAVFPHEVNRIWVREMSCFCASCFKIGFQPNTSCKGWRIANLKQISNVSETTESILPEINEHVAAIYNQAVYVGKITKIDEKDAYITFYEHNGDITKTTIFRMPKRKDQVWIRFHDIICVLPEPNDTKRGKKFDEVIVKVIKERFSQWKRKN